MPRKKAPQCQTPQRARRSMSRSVDSYVVGRGEGTGGDSHVKERFLGVRWIVVATRLPAFCLLAVFLCVGGIALLSRRFDGLIYPNISVGPYNIGGFSRQEASRFLRERFDEFETKGVAVRAEDVVVRIHGVVSGVQDPDLSYELYTVDVDATVERLLTFGKSGSRVSRGIRVVSQLLHPKRYPFVVEANYDRIVSVLRENFSRLEQPPKQPVITFFEDAKTGSRRVLVSGEEIAPGTTFAYRAAAEAVANRIASLSDEEVVLERMVDRPELSRELFMREHESIVRRLNTIVSGPELILATSTATGSVRFVVPHNELVSMIELRENASGHTGERVVFGARKQSASLIEKLNRVFGREVRDAKFVVEQGRVVEFQSAQAGYHVSAESVMRSVEEFLNSNLERSSPKLIEVERREPALQTSDVNDFGIREMIGVGRSNFAGSPPNRRHNIMVGARSVNGTLIPPGEEFSLLKTLGEISGRTGYLPELVIKGDRTIPEYGGGLCQIGTTTFRGALDAGLPITARTNHSYRVSYYEPAGTDATIYDPSPDFRFLNDTGHYILIQTRVEGNELVFEFWGTRDGRKVVQTKPRIFNIVAPPETKYIETTDLKPGEERCTERAHAGADAEFTYSVTYPDGTVKERVFKSRYRPWQEVCLKGVATPATSTGEFLSNE